MTKLCIHGILRLENSMRKHIAVMIAILGLCVAGRVQAEMSSANFSIQGDSLSAGGSDTSSSASYLLRDTVGNQAGGLSTSGSYGLNAGYRQGTFDEVITFEFGAQDQSSEVVATGISGTTVSVSSTTPFFEGGFVALVQDIGVSQVVAVGAVQSIGVGTITVVEFSGGSPTIDGTNDYLYAMSGTSLDFGTLTGSSVTTRLVGFDVSADVPGGYTIQLAEDGNLRNGGEDIDDVADGTVTAGQEEYGARSSDGSIADSTFDTQDTAITSSYQTIVASSAPFQDHSFVTLKASVNGATSAGVYAQTLTFIVSGNY